MEETTKPFEKCLDSENEVNKILIESITKVGTGKIREKDRKFPIFNIRVWRGEYLDPKEHDITKMQFDGTRNKIENAIVLYKRYHKGVYTTYSLGKYIMTKVSRVNAVEVLDKEGIGVVLYADWP